MSNSSPSNGPPTSSMYVRLGVVPDGRVGAVHASAQQLLVVAVHVVQPPPTTWACPRNTASRELLGPAARLGLHLVHLDREAAG